VENRISGLEDEIDIKEKTEELLYKRHKSCERNTQDLSDSIKRPNLQIMGNEGEEVQVKGIHNIFNKIIVENFPNLKEELSIQVKEASKTPKRKPKQNLSTAYYH
jgi:hypothetical protein